MSAQTNIPVLGLLLFSTAFQVAACHVRPETLLPEGAVTHRRQHSEHLCSAPASFVVVGDETSFVWPALLQDVLDAHAGTRGLYRVTNDAALTGSIGTWTSAEGPMRVVAEELHSATERSAPAPTTALCVVTLRGLSDERGPVKSANDMVGAEMGADALEELALALHAAGIERVVFATPLYDERAEPERGFERVALERLLARGHTFVEAGPDVFHASRRYFPDAYEDDHVHPNEFGAKLVAEEWYRWLAGPDAREEAVQALYAKDYDVAAIEAAYAERRGLGP